MSRRLVSALVVGGLSLFAACGDDSDSDRADTQTTETQATGTTATPPLKERKGTPLRRALKPRCGVGEFPPPTVTHVKEFGGWTLAYQYPNTKKPPPTIVATALTLEERPPDSTAQVYVGSREARFHGRDVTIAGDHRPMDH
jgi:hypothetical protein